MAVETEIKLKVASHGPVRDKLRALGAKRVGSVMETNRFFDRADHALLSGDRGLRLRTNLDDESGKSTHIVTYKGPRQRGPVKKREEIEFGVDDPENAARVFEVLGLELELSFQKRRESWELDACKIELDEVPHLGTFVEIEGFDAKCIQTLQTKLGLEREQSIQDSYIGLLMAWRKQHRVSDRDIRF
jgi:adenylate cyclase, class 2